MITVHDFDVAVSFDASIADRPIEWLPPGARTWADAVDPGNHIPDAWSDQWQVVPSDLRRHLISVPVAGFERTVRIFRLATAPRARLDAVMAWHARQPRYDIAALQRRLDESALLTTDFRCLDPSATRLLGLARIPAGRHTAARDKERRVVGIHLDTFDMASMELRHTSRNRISINVCPWDRYLLFVPYTAWRLVEIARREAQPWSEEALRDHRMFVLAFFRDLAPPIFRVRLEPGDGYVAPTENMLHDGSTFTARADDVSLTWLGYFERIDGASGR
jgi:hypothetical protein